jgi:hypothetical protein
MSRYTKISVWMVLAGAGLLGASTNAQASGGPGEIDVGFHCNFSHCGARATLGPWYAYFPYDAHFQIPAPVGMYPNWPTPFPPPVAVPVPFPPPSIPATLPFPPPPTPVPPPPSQQAPRTAPTTQAPIQPVGYYPYGYGYGYGYQVPSYWYGR